MQWVNKNRDCKNCNNGAAPKGSKCNFNHYTDDYTYDGVNLPCLGITTGMSLTTIIQKLDNFFCGTGLTQMILSQLSNTSNESFINYVNDNFDCSIAENCIITTSTTTSTTTECSTPSGLSQAVMVFSFTPIGQPTTSYWQTSEAACEVTCELAQLVDPQIDGYMVLAESYSIGDLVWLDPLSGNEQCTLLMTEAWYIKLPYDNQERKVYHIQNGEIVAIEECAICPTTTSTTTMEPTTTTTTSSTTGEPTTTTSTTTLLQELTARQGGTLEDAIANPDLTHFLVGDIQVGIIAIDAFTFNPILDGYYVIEECVTPGTYYYFTVGGGTPGQINFINNC